MPTRTLQVSTRRQKQVIDITSRVEQYLDQLAIREGLCNVFVTHTTVCLTTGEAIEGTDEDLMETLEEMIPDALPGAQLKLSLEYRNGQARS